MTEKIKCATDVSVVEFYKGRKFLRIRKTVEGFCSSSIYLDKFEALSVIEELRKNLKNL